MSSIWLNYYSQDQQLSQHLYKLLALTLNLDEHWFDNKISLQAQNHFNGDLVSRWTNDHWISTPHRVIASLNNNSACQSIASFCQININEIVTCIPTCYSKNKPSKYPPIRS
ncbi:unnamed protein product [Adineta steineri]|uniref:Uncharacterized protein n=1 Tax=Adineta steineri TaxID=433720 RepID=A0A814WSK6_9BILA|nr:unnamed protein product [Adineta steineri]CAF3994530.1 unnamed protein product [Adineta steineri]